MIEKAKAYKYKIYEHIKEAIIHGEYKQGEVLNERKLAEELGISRTPVREALQMLIKDGWAVSESYKKTLVRTFDPDYISNAQDVRRALEILAIEEAIWNMNEKSLEELKFYLKMQERCLMDNHPSEFMKYDQLFHEQIYLNSKNELLVSLIKNLNDIIRFLGIKVLMIGKRKSKTIEEHQKIVDAIENRNLKLAREAMDFHLKNTREAIIKYSNSTP